MKTTTIYISLIAALAFLFTGCGDDFVQKEYWKPVLSLEMETDLPERESGRQSISFSIPDAGNSSYKVVQYPMWMGSVNLSGNASDDIITLNYNYLYGIAYETDLDFLFAFEINGIGQVEVLVHFEEKLSSVLSIQPTSLDFGMESTTQAIQVHNNGTKPFSLIIESCPDWLKHEYGIQIFSIDRGGVVNLNFNCVRSGFESGKHTGNIVLKVNSEVYTIPVMMEVEIIVDNDLFTIDGSVVNAAFDKANGIMYIATKAPDKVIIYNVNTDAKSEVSLNKAPKCIKLSENGKQAFVGHSGLISIVDTEKMQVETTIDVEYNIFDLVYGENNFCYISIDENYKYGLQALNIKTKESTQIGDHSLNFTYQTLLYKIKGKPLLAGTRTTLSPGGVIIGDISDPTSIKEKYWHEGYGKYWFSEDQSYIFTPYGYVFKTPNMSTNNLYILHNIPRDETIRAIEHSAALNSIWVATETSFWNQNNAISRFDCVNYSLQETVYPAKIRQSINGKTNIYKTAAHFLFAEKNGNYLYCIKNIISDNNQTLNRWSVEKIKLN